MTYLPLEVSSVKRDWERMITELSLTHPTPPPFFWAICPELLKLKLKTFKIKAIINQG